MMLYRNFGVSSLMIALLFGDGDSDDGDGPNGGDDDGDDDDSEAMMMNLPILGAIVPKFRRLFQSLISFAHVFLVI